MEEDGFEGIHPLRVQVETRNKHTGAEVRRSGIHAERTIDDASDREEKAALHAASDAHS